jgi:hypothetical protein
MLFNVFFAKKKISEISESIFLLGAWEMVSFLLFYVFSYFSGSISKLYSNICMQY